MNFKLPQSIKLTLDTLIKNGHKAYIVGGCVRDLLCGKTPHDYDITTSALPCQIQSLFDKTITTGIKHGTVTVVIDGETIEVTTFRTENSYTDSRHPDGVSFVSDVKQDLARRDFTVNAICYNHQDGLIDCFGGQDDIKARVLRAVGNAETRFREDALRILRLFRFSATLGFTIECQTFDAAIRCAPLLSNISAERIFTELQKAAQGANVVALYPLFLSGALNKYCLGAADLGQMQNLENQENLRTFALLNVVSSDINKTTDSLKCSNKFKVYCQKMRYLSKNIIKADKISIKNALNFAGEDIVRDALLYYRDALGHNTSVLTTMLNEIMAAKEPFLISHLDITGDDIKALDIDGKSIGDTLQFLLNNTIEDPTLNDREKLIKLICN